MMTPFFELLFGDGVDFDQAVAGGGIEIEVIELLEGANALEGRAAEGAFPVESMEDDAFQQIAKREIVIFGEGFEDFENALFHANAGLNPFDCDCVPRLHCRVPMYHGTSRASTCGRDSSP